MLLQISAQWMASTEFVPFDWAVRISRVCRAGCKSSIKGLLSSVSSRQQPGAESSRVWHFDPQSTGSVKVITLRDGISPSSSALISSVKSEEQFLDNEKFVALGTVCCSFLPEIYGKALTADACVDTQGDRNDLDPGTYFLQDAVISEYSVTACCVSLTQWCW